MKLACSQGCNIRRINKRHKDWKEEMKLILETGNMIIYSENSKESTNKLLELSV